MRYWIQERTWAAAACWQLLIALRLPRNDWCLMGHRAFEEPKNVSEVQLNEKISPTIADLKVTLVMGSRLRKLIKSGRESAEVSWDPKQEEILQDEDVPSPSEEPRKLGRAQEDEKIIPAIADSDDPLS